MEKVYTFNKSVRGHLHVMRDIPCEDYSCSFSDKNGRYHIAAVADGHGADSCFRSAKGSKFACEAALNCLKQFADSILSSDESENTLYYEAFSDRTSLDVTLRRLTDLISAEWYDEVMADYEKNPPTSEEMGDYSEMYKDGSKTTHIYGTTLIAALLLPSHLLLFQQGDGRCEVFFDDGTIEQPIPWDNRCQDTATTSLCDDDVLESFRSAVINLNKKKVIACYLGSDGVEDAYRDTYEDLGGMHCVMGGVHAFYKHFTCKIMDTTIEDFAFLQSFIKSYTFLGYSLKKVGSSAFDTYCVNAYDGVVYDEYDGIVHRHGYMYSKTPPEGVVFLSSDGKKRNGLLHVPVGCKEAYQQAEGWKQYGENIVDDINLEGIHHAQLKTQDSDAPTYDLQGRRVAHPKQGEIYIQNGRKIRK